LILALKDSLEKKRQIFLEKLIPHHPPLLGDWFYYAFPDPYSWYVNMSKSQFIHIYKIRLLGNK
jgi:hypothetical protein